MWGEVLNEAMFWGSLVAILLLRFNSAVNTAICLLNRPPFLTNSVTALSAASFWIKYDL